MTLLLIPFLPLAAFVVLILFGRRLGKFSAGVSLLALAGSLYFSVRSFFLLLAAHDPLRFSWIWLPIGEHPLRIGFLMDPLSATMCGVVTVVGWLIMLYSIGYMGEDPRFSRFFAYLSLFFSAMLTLVLADNLLLLYIGWEGVGLCSYLLISFWFERPAAANAGKKAFLTTRVGDLGLLGGILLIAKLTGDLSLTGLESKAAALGAWAPAAALLIFWGAVGKSAQFPLHVWLPDAMEGPTPVSALIHAATMVAAGIYLVARTMPLFLPNPQVMFSVAMVGGITSFFAATIACTQTDLKRILAYSTLSQLGFMMMGLGAGSSFAGMFHLVTHAWFKALLFLGAGSVIHAVHHQDVTKMGGLWKSMPVTALTFTVAAVAMAGIPPLSGFWSKEEILSALASFNPFFLYIGLAITFLTAFYISRAVILTFAGKSHVIPAKAGIDPRFREDDVHESPLVMTIPLLILMAGAAGIGFIGTAFTGHWFQHFLAAAESVRVPSVPDTEVAWIQPAAIALAAGGIGLALLRYGLGIHLLPGPLRRLFLPVYELVSHKYYIDEIYDRLIIQPVLRLARRSFSFDAGVVDGAVNRAGTAGLSLSAFKGWVDRTLVDGAVNGVGLTLGRAGAALRLLQTGLVQNHLLIAASGAVTLFLLFRWVF
ncbi:MAG: NADH-quinone oxidoreductase subunit L [Candidatus Omnitrophica bacterium]|nr:NADH-quinone oxidoreductase subunit L [Candidatus Omnitrophota bacterium]